jgi:hypothetical protein
MQSICSLFLLDAEPFEFYLESRSLYPPVSVYFLLLPGVVSKFQALYLGFWKDIKFCQRCFLHLLRWSCGFVRGSVYVLNLCMLNHSCIPGMKPTWLTCQVIILMTWFVLEGLRSPSEQYGSYDQHSYIHVKQDLYTKQVFMSSLKRGETIRWPHLEVCRTTP